MTVIFNQNDDFFSPRTILNEFFEFTQLVTTVIFSQLETNHVIQQSTEESYMTCRPPEAEFGTDTPFGTPLKQKYKD